MEFKDNEFSLLVKKSLPDMLKILEDRTSKQSKVEITVGEGLGAKGLFVQIQNKYVRLKSELWNSEEVLDWEYVCDTAIDLANYALALAGIAKSEIGK